MKKMLQSKNKATWLLLTGILVLCAGFIIAGCGIGTGPQVKVQDPNKGQYALDFTDCPISNACLLALEASSALPADNQLSDKPLTFEAWIKPKANSTGTVMQRGDVKKGAILQVRATSTPNSVVPRFEIRRVQSDGTSSVAYFVDGTLLTINSVWTHIAGVLTNQDHSAAAGHSVCAGVDGDATDDPWHLDIYQDGTLTACAETHDNQVADDTPAAAAYAHEPDAHTGNIKFSGIIDEARIWNTDRAESGGLSLCMNRELDISGNCGYENNMVMYLRFNEGDGHSVADFSGAIGSGVKEYADGSGHFPEWTTGWTTDTPF